MALKSLFAIEKKPHKGLLTVEWVILGYLVMTLLFVLFTSTKLPNAEELIWGRIKVFAVTMAMWAVYRMLPCRFTHLCRITVQLALLSWWYPEDTTKPRPSLCRLRATGVWLSACLTLP